MNVLLDIITSIRERNESQKHSLHYVDTEMDYLFRSFVLACHADRLRVIAHHS